MNIGKAIKDLRKAVDWQQEELAGRAGITQAYLCQIEGGRKDPTIKTLQAIANALKVPLAFILVSAIDRNDTIYRHNPDDKFVEYALEQGKLLLLKAL